MSRHNLANFRENGHAPFVIPVMENRREQVSVSRGGHGLKEVATETGTADPVHRLRNAGAGGIAGIRLFQTG